MSIESWPLVPDTIRSDQMHRDVLAAIHLAGLVARGLNLDAKCIEASLAAADKLVEQARS
jgi:hypothetical protein